MLFYYVALSLTLRNRHIFINISCNIMCIIIFRSNNDVIKKKSSPLRENKRQNSEDFIPLNVNNEDNNIKKSKYNHKNKK